ncbi:MAG TPA: L-2-hydroxyglutarate oxidase [Bryobacteraceae bacterium]|nr:L-2-hydroxyglutarate oxidase [Bryobacteraceae bacterium]
MTYDIAIAGGGIVGLSTALALTSKFPHARIVLIEKEDEFALHQTGRNSGVIHSGIYYKPGSYKAFFCRTGNATMVRFCQEHGIPYDVCGKVIVAANVEELPALHRLHVRAQENGLEVHKLTPEQLKEREPHVHCVSALVLPSTGITSFKQVSLTYARLATERGATLLRGAQVLSIKTTGGATQVLETTKGAIETKFLVNCCGLHSDRVARMSGADPQVRIVPFRGEYYELKPDKRYLVKHLIYPVPNPAFPFLGVHFTRMIDGSIHAGPNAVLAFKREGYTKTSFDLKDTTETFTYGGFWSLAAKHAAYGWSEMVRSWSRNAFLRSLQRLIPEVQAEDIEPSNAGVRAQALMPDGGLVDDFLFVEGPKSLHVCNAPSPAATSSIPIGESIAERVEKALA